MMPETYVDGARGLRHPCVMSKQPVQPSQNQNTEKAKAVLARNLQALMDQQDWNQVELARRSEVSQRHISDILNRRTDATAGVIDKLASAFGRRGYELQIEGLHEALKASSGSLSDLVSAYVKDPDNRALLDAALNLLPSKKRP
jgi:transcriptional regulator with XRE-family HTH domain